MNLWHLWQNYWGGGEEQEECLKNMGHALPLKAINLPEPNMNVDVSKNRVPKIEWIITIIVILIGMMHFCCDIPHFWGHPALISWGCLDTSSEDRSNPGKKKWKQRSCPRQKVAPAPRWDSQAAARRLLLNQAIAWMTSCLAWASNQDRAKATKKSARTGGARGVIIRMA